MDDKEMLAKVNSKVSFVYEINEKAYVIGHSKVFDTSNSRIINPNYKEDFKKYREIVISFKEGKEIDRMRTDRIMNIIIGCASSEITSEENQKNIIDIGEFWSTLKEEEKKILYNEVIDFENMFIHIGIAMLHPKISRY